MSEQGMTTAWFTFGQCHNHQIGAKVFDNQCVVSITSEDPRATMFQTFGRAWSMQYDDMPDMRYYPRGIIEL